MENTVNFSVSPVQLLLALAFQVWMIVFPIIIIRKLNHLTDLMQAYFETDHESSS